MLIIIDFILKFPFEVERQDWNSVFTSLTNKNATVELNKYK